MRLEFSRKIFKIKMPNSMKNCPVEDECLRADGQTDVMMLIEILCKFTNGPKMSGTVPPLALTPLFMDMESNESQFILERKDYSLYSCT